MKSNNLKSPMCAMSCALRRVGAFRAGVWLCLAALAILTIASPSTAGTFNVVPITGDADSGISNANTYTHALDFAGPGAAVNGVSFISAGQNGGNYSLINVPNGLDASASPTFNEIIPPGNGTRTLIDTFYYGGGATEYVQLGGLTPGVSYSARFYSSPWTLGDNRTQLVTSGGDSFSFNEDGNNAQYLDYTFTATGPTRVISFSAANPSGGSMHQYAMSNQVAAAAPPPTFLQSLPGLFNTGVNASGTAIPDSGIDPHYTLTVNPNGASTDAIAQIGIPSPPWVANSGVSRWVGPVANTSGAAGGVYTYQTTFDLTGYNPLTASLKGVWATDNPGPAIRLNGQVVGGAVNTVQFPSFTEFNISAGSPFLPGLNTLEFDVENQGAGFTGLHVSAFQGTAVSSAVAIASIGTIYNTGVDAAHVALAAGSADPHYQIIAAADPNFSPPAPAVVQSNHPAWMANTAASSWISTVPVGETNIAGGQYIFETSFDLTGFDENAVNILGKFAADNSVDEVYLNGNLVAGVSGGGFTFWTPFTLDSGFQAGVNTLTFLFTNAPGAPPADNPGGFRLEMSGFAVVPEPSSVVLGLVGALGLGLIARRRTK